MPIIDTKKLPVLEKRAGWHGRLFHSQNNTFVHWTFEKDSSIHEHHHEQEEVWHVMEGEIEVTIGGKTHRAGPGTVAIIPPNTPHSVRTLSDGMAIVVDFPLRKDFG